MTKGLLILILCQLAGEIVRTTLGLPLPGPVIAMFLLAAILIVGQKDVPEKSPDPTSDLDTVSDVLIRHMSLLFIPAGVGILSAIPLLHGSWLAAVGALIGSTLLSLVATALTMNWWISRSAPRSNAEDVR